MKPAGRPDGANRARCGTVASAGDWPAGRAWLRGLVGAAAGLLNVGYAAGEAPVAPTEEYRAAAVAPVEWRNFAKRLQQRLQERLAADDEDARRFRDAIAQAGKDADRPFLLKLRAWIEADGKVERIEVDGFDSGSATAEYLRRLLRLDGVGAPPADMLQPVRLGLSLRPKDPGK